MRWKRKSNAEKIEALCKWHKVFLFTPMKCIETGETIWLESMYRRAVEYDVWNDVPKSTIIIFDMVYYWEYKKDLLEILKD